MALKIVGTGLGRTGTSSLKLALEELGFGPCYHMSVVRHNPDHLPYWQAAARGELPDWDVLFADFAACVDWPCVLFWRQLIAHYPDAKIIHTERPEESWLKSIHATIYPVVRDADKLQPGYNHDRIEMAREIILEQTFNGKLGDREHALAVYRAHNDKVRQTIPANRMLIYDVAGGWGPLCTFLGVPVPDRPFPHANAMADFQARHADTDH